MTLDVYRPVENANGAGVLFIVSGGYGWYSPVIGSVPLPLDPPLFKELFTPLTDDGFTVFAVRHGSSPKFTIPEAVEDVRRSVRFVRLHAERFQIDPQRLGVYGINTGGHLALMLGTTSDDGDPQADDPVLRTSSRVQAVAAEHAPTDLRGMVWQAPDRGAPALELSVQQAAKVSPLLHASPGDAPTLLIAADFFADPVPIEHSRKMHAVLQEHGVTVRMVELPVAALVRLFVERKGVERAVTELRRWFGQHLATR